VQPLYYELSVLTKAVKFKNLSAAALHVGLSQSQLSRIIAKLEGELNVVLLDRTAKRKSGWTPVAFHLTEIFEKSHKRMETEILAASNQQMVSELHIGSLDGLSMLAMKTAHACFEKIGIRKISLDIYDLSELESHFLSGNLDLVYTSKIPGKQKFRHLAELGFQTMEEIETNKKYGVFSTFEFNRSSKKELDSFEHLLMSNSLAIKKEWFRQIGGTGRLPSEPRRSTGKTKDPVLLIGSDLLSPLLWEKIQSTVADDLMS
jgi:hypothetical protein